MRVFLTGGTGFIGSHILQTLLARGHQVRALTRKPGAHAAVTGVEWVAGDVADAGSLAGLADGCEAVVHLVGIIEERRSRGITFEAIHHVGTRNVVDAARSAGIKRFVNMSANGARANGVSAYQTTKWKAEEYVRRAGFDHYVIFRPAVIFGDPGPEHPEFSKRLAKSLVRPFPILPVPGDGKYEIQPVSIQEVASAFEQALTLTAAHGQSYCAAGRERVTFNDVLDRIAVALGHEPKPKVHHPLWMVRTAVRAAERTGKLPITLDQLEMLVEGNTCDSTRFYEDFGVTYRPYSPENLDYLRRYV